MKKTISDLDVKDKTVLVRADFNVPLAAGEITDDTRIVMALPTIRTLMEREAKVLLCSHLGRPGGRVVEELRLTAVAQRLSEHLSVTVSRVDETVGEQVKNVVSGMSPKEVLLLENTRFQPGEKDNSEEFARQLAELADVFVNDAFAAAHRAHASTEKVAHYLPAVAGLLMDREIKALEKVLHDPKNPVAAIFGGAKISGKIRVIERMLDTADMLMVGGGMANTFLKAKGVDIGDSRVETDQVHTARNILNKASDRVILPRDVVVAEAIEAGAVSQTVDVDDVPPGWHIVDVGPKTLKRFRNEAGRANMVVWNGPLGVYEMEPFSRGTIDLMKTVAELAADTVVGGGDLGAVVTRTGLADQLTHFSTGGGAFLDFLAEKELPGITALADKE